MPKIAIIYASHDGHTKAICETIQAALHQDVDLLSVNVCEAEVIEAYDVLVFGSSIRYGKHLKPMTRFLSAHKAALATKKTAFFSVNLTARKPNRDRPETSNYVKKLLAKLDWQPTLVDVFAGKLDYPNYRFYDKHIIRFIMWLTNGPTDLSTVQVFTDWQRVVAFAKQVEKLCAR